MKDNKYKKYNSTLTMLFMGLLLSNCAKHISKDPVAEVPVTENRITETPPAEEPKRLCTDVITNTTSAKLAEFFQKVVRNIEGPPTFCLTLDTSAGASGAKGTLRLEYEDDFGIRYYQILEEATYYGELTQTETETTLDLVFIDGAGFVQVKGTDNGTGLMNGTIKYHNFPSFEASMEAAAKEAAQKCKDGTMTVAQCLGYNFPSTYWWNQPIPTSPKQQMLDQAKAILKDPTKTKTLGNIQFDLGLVLTQ